METLLNVLPNLSIGVVSILGLIFVVIKFLEALDKRAERHEKAMLEREEALRRTERDVRIEIAAQLAASTSTLKDTARVMEQNTRVMERAVLILDKH